MTFAVEGSNSEPEPPGVAMPISPDSSVSGNPTFTWNVVSNATYYYLWVDDSTGNKIKKWYTAANCGCDSSSTCSATPGTSLSGNGTWWVQTWNDTGYGPWSSGMNFTAGVSGAPGTATLTSPSGSTLGTTPTYTWEAVTGATYYYLWVDDSTGNKIKKWSTATQCGCESSTTCSIIPATNLDSGDATWWIRTWNDEGYGPWSSSMSFSVLE